MICQASKLLPVYIHTYAHWWRASVGVVRIICVLHAPDSKFIQFFLVILQMYAEIKYTIIAVQFFICALQFIRSLIFFLLFIFYSILLQVMVFLGWTNFYYRNDYIYLVEMNSIIWFCGCGLKTSRIICIGVVQACRLHIDYI